MSGFLTNMYFIQAIGFISFGFAIAAFSSRDDRRFKMLMFIDCLFLVVHFYLLGAHAAAFSIAIIALRNVVSLFKKAQGMAPLFILAFLVMGIFNYETWIDFCPIIAPIVGTYGLFHYKNIPMRLCFLFANICWITHNYVVGSIGPLLMESSLFTINIYTILVMAGVIKGIRKKSYERKIDI